MPGAHDEQDGIDKIGSRPFEVYKLRTLPASWVRRLVLGSDFQPDAWRIVRGRYADASDLVDQRETLGRRLSAQKYVHRFLTALALLDRVGEDLKNGFPFTWFGHGQALELVEKYNERFGRGKFVEVDKTLV